MDNILITLAIVAGSVIALIAVILTAINKFYVVPKADEALVKTGGRAPTVSTGGGLWVIPMFHRIARVSLRAVHIPIDRIGDNSLPTANKIPAEIRGELIVQVNPADSGHIILAAQAIGSDSVSMEKSIQSQVDSLVTDALRTAAFKKTFEELNSQKSEFADEVTQLLAGDLAKLGLILVAVTIPHLKQGDFSADDRDVFAAEGQRNVAETVAKARQETNQITRQAENRVQEQDVVARKRSLELDAEQKELEAEQARKVSEFTATKATETKRLVLEQEQQRAVAEAEQKKTILASQIKQDKETESLRIEKEQTIAVANARAEAAKAEAEIARQKTIESATIAKDQEVKVADEQRQQAVQEAVIAREKAVAIGKAEEAVARESLATAEAKRQKAEQSIITAEAVGRADRERQVVVIKAEEEAERVRKAADRDTYVAEQRAKAVKAEADGNAESVKAEAQGRADSVKIEATAEAEARVIRANAISEASDKESAAKIALAKASLEEGKAVAESARLLVEAQNKVSNASMIRDVVIAAIQSAPAITHEIMAPIAKVSDVRVLQINGLNGSSGPSSESVPGVILGAGLAASGALPLIREAMQGLAANPEVSEIVGMLGQTATTTLRGAVSAIRDQDT